MKNLVNILDHFFALIHPLLTSRIVLILIAIVGSYFGWRETNFYMLFHYDIPIIGLFTRWDVPFYSEIALMGYWKQDLYAFRPLYSLILRFLYPIFRGFKPIEAVITAGFFWNLMCLIPISFFLKKLTEMLYDTEVARKTLLLLAIYPSTLFLTATYTEATYLLLIVASFYYLEREKFIPATFFGFLAGLTKPEGFLIAIPFFLKIFNSENKSKLFIASSVIGSTLPLFMLFSYFGTGDPFMSFKVERVWPKTTLWELPFEFDAGQTPFYAMNIVIMAVAVISIVYYIQQNNLSLENCAMPYFLWALTLITILIYEGGTRSWSRYTLTIPPILWSLTSYSDKHPSLFEMMIICFALGMTLSTVFYVNWYQIL